VKGVRPHSPEVGALYFQGPMAFGRCGLFLDQLDGFVPAFFAFCGMAIPWSTPLAAGHLESLMGRSHFRKTLVFLDIPVLFVLCPFVLVPWSSPASGFWLLTPVSWLVLFPVHPSSLRVCRSCVAPARQTREVDPSYRGDRDQTGRFPLESVTS